MIFVREGFIVKQIKNSDTKNAETFVLSLPLLRKSGASFLRTVPQTLAKKNFLMKFQLT